MSITCLEVVTLRLRPGVSDAEFLKQSALQRTEMAAVRGVLGRCLAKGDDGVWVDVVAWAGQADHDRAMEELPSKPATAAWFALMDLESINMHIGAADGGAFVAGGILELVLGKMQAGISANMALEAVPATTRILKQMQGYLSRVSATTADGVFIDAVWWQDHHCAVKAAAQFPTLPETQAFMRLFSTETRMFHLTPT